MSINCNFNENINFKRAKEINKVDLNNLFYSDITNIKKKMKLHSRKIRRQYTVQGVRKRQQMQQKNYPMAIKQLELNVSQCTNMTALSKALQLKLKDSAFMILGDKFKDSKINFDFIQDKSKLRSMFNKEESRPYY